MITNCKEVYQEDLLNSQDFSMAQAHDSDGYIGRVIVKGIGVISILDRLTGYIGYVRDIETGFRAQCQEEYKLISEPDQAKRYANFWLASGNFDIRTFEGTYAEAIQHIKNNANTCIGELATI